MREPADIELGHDQLLPTLPALQVAMHNLDPPNMRQQPRHHDTKSRKFATPAGGAQVAG